MLNKLNCLDNRSLELPMHYWIKTLLLLPLFIGCSTTTTKRSVANDNWGTGAKGVAFCNYYEFLKQLNEKSRTDLEKYSIDDGTGKMKT